MSVKVYAIVVAYHPHDQALARLTSALLESGCEVVIVDNTPRCEVNLTDSTLGCKVLSLGENTGIAHAQNIGIGFARRNSADVVVFFDQDSAIDRTFIRTLIADLDTSKPGIVGPLCFDAVRGFEYPSYRLSRWGYPLKVRGDGACSPYAVDLIIASGSAATTATFDLAGAMDESFFIDYVDLEWCIRCRRLGVPIWVNPRVTMQHTIGESSLDVGPVKAFMHGPTRSYYRVRNAFLLFRKKHVPIVFAAREVISAIGHHLLVLPLVARKSEHFKVYFLGIFDGIRGVTGRKV